MCSPRRQPDQPARRRGAVLRRSRLRRYLRGQRRDRRRARPDRRAQLPRRRSEWLAERHPEWKGLRSLAAVAARRIDKKTGCESLETRDYITSLEPDPKAILAATRAHWGVESFHWTLDVTFDEDRCRTRKDASAINFAIIRHTGYNLLNADKTLGSMRRKRLRACIDPMFRSNLFAAYRFRISPCDPRGLPLTKSESALG